MRSGAPCVLALNGGSSSIRCAVSVASKTLRRRFDGKIDRIGSSGTNLTVNDATGTVSHRVAATDHRTATAHLLDWLEAQPLFASVKAAGHRAVQGLISRSVSRVLNLGSMRKT